MSLRDEGLLTLPEARKQFPGRPPALITMRRYVTVGLRGVVLESLLLNACRFTSRPAIDRFLIAASAPRAAKSNKAEGVNNG
ncbi:hypothetical protein Poly24_06660 [Rosistilla carotiformis]|uniref:Uncharacterized protein n=1 Tax=Rosistilla carotiformis TaxID=2528017 RepID=A0A518JN41_9BACT|nr:DUF1580 domain-containing protein [Rosistilla carotiformis]QDV66976.1 hypothetical protein Poly24_06660 [Rosistilla carotiformis]